MVTVGAVNYDYGILSTIASASTWSEFVDCGAIGQKVLVDLTLFCLSAFSDEQLEFVSISISFGRSPTGLDSMGSIYLLKMFSTCFQS